MGKMDKNKAKTDKKRAQEWKKVKSRSRGSLMIKETSKYLWKSSKIQKVVGTGEGED